MKTDTIAAIATARGAAGIAVVRISGPQAWEVAAKVCHLKAAGPAGSFRHVSFFEGNEIVDDGLVLFFRAPASYTGEDVVELQGHGGRIPSERLLSAALAAGASLAEPGEFTRRAFLNGKVDLTRAEAVMDLIGARTERAARAARAQMEGRLADGIDAIYGQLVEVGSDVEHLLDFDEDEVPDGFCEKAADDLRDIVADIDRLLAGWHAGILLREGALAVISGAPNAGKSSLLNALLGRSRAIVSAVPGTTRDAIEESMSLGGIPVRLVDTAGLRDEALDEIEAEGIARAGQLLHEADLHLRVIDGTGHPGPDILGGLPPDRTVVVWNKSDLAPVTPSIAVPDGCRAVRVSAKTGEGLDDLKAAMSAILGDDTDAASGVEISQRHRECLSRSRENVVEAVDCLGRDAEGLVLAAQRIAAAADDIGRVTGRVWSEELLDAIFHRFCVGK